MFALTLTVLVVTIDAQWEGMGDVGSARYFWKKYVFVRLH